MLMITVALAGAAYMYISGMFSSAKQCILIVDKYCTTTSGASFVIRNICTENITADTITVTRTSPAGNPSALTCCPYGIPPRTTRTYSDTNCPSGSQCSYRFLAPTGQAIEDSVYCP
jgi:hypothetical protein